MVLKVFKRLIKNQIVSYVKKNYQHIFLAFAKKEHLKKRANKNLLCSLDNKIYSEVGLMDLSEAFDKIKHDLLITKLPTYSFDKSSSNVCLFSYLTNIFQRVKRNCNLIVALVLAVN